MSRYKIDQEFLKAFGNNLRKIRKAKSVSQEELAYRADLTLPQVGRLERGEINSGLTIVAIISKALEVPAKDLFDF